MGKVSSLGICFIILIIMITVADAVSIENLKKLNISETDLWDPVLSPDGTRIAYAAYDEARSQQIFVINADGTGKKKLTNDTIKKWGLAWGADKIAYVSFGKDGLEKIFVIKPDGTENRQLILDNTRQGKPAEDKPPPWAAPSWSSDGKFLVYTSLDEMGNSKMYIVNEDGTGKRLVFKDNFKQWSPAISMDGKNIVYVSYNEIFKEELFIVDVAGTARRQLTFDGIKKNNPVWGPEGTITYVSYESMTSSGENIFAINQDGTNRRLLVDSDFRQRSPSWSGDGKKFSYAAMDISGNVKIAVGYVVGITATITQTEITPTAITPTPTATGTTHPTETAVETPEVKETPAESASKEVVFTMVLVLGIIVILMLGLLVLSDVFKKK